MRVNRTAIILLSVSTLLLAGCRDSNRPLHYDKGVYSGKADTGLTSEQVETLRQRGKRSYQ